MAVKDTSMPPDTITISTPIAKMPVTMMLRKRSKRLAIVKKVGLMRPMPRLRTTMSHGYQGFVTA